MAKIREIKDRMKAVANIQRITKTMQMIATARLQACEKRATEAKPYSRKIVELAGQLASSLIDDNTSQASHPLLRQPDPPVHRQLLLVITSSRGLCGGYNGNILRTATAFLKQHSDQQVDLEVVGKKGLAYFRYSRIPVNIAHSQFTDQPAYKEVEQLANRYIQEFSAGKYDAVQITYMTFESMSSQVAKTVPLLPLQNPAESTENKPRSTTQYDFSPDPAALLNALLPVTVKTQLFQCFNEAIVAEQLARMVAMKSATDAAEKMGKDLTRTFNRARQTAITTELTEVVSGAAALQ